MGTINENTKFGWAVMVALIAIAFGMGGVYFKVESVDVRLSRLEDILIKSPTQVSLR